MAGNSQRQGAVRKRGKNAPAGSGGRIRKSLEGKGPTPKAEDRTYHKAHKQKKAAERRAQTRPRSAAGSRGGSGGTGPEWVIGRNPVLEALQAGIPVHTAYVAEGAERDNRLRDILQFAAEHSIALLQVTRGELDRLTKGAVHQGVALQLPAFEYAEPADVLDAALDSNGVVVVLDHITDPRNLGAIIRSAAAFGAEGVVIPQRRAAGMTAAAWKTSAGAAARIPVARATNLNRVLDSAHKAGFLIVGLAGDTDLELSEVEVDDQPVVFVVGSEDAGLGRLVREHCDQVVRIPMPGGTESLNASVAAGIALYELTRR
ncbi:23S rRNA (guanosine(2251)-2'-O)-methyltransferase RlmB [Enemella sp. A6]|uniref:23S rRNA (guanosine(2251)-2'-O)-methyltransferase RlmB n=1 Tax=Enemella sp. A6 TaxID=3440152 RepID=UPI003EBFBCA2